MKNKTFSYRSDIDGLRGIAVLAVVAYHCLPKRIKGGFVGVDVFFVISGFLISSIIYEELDSGTFSIVEFYVRRVRRIYPALFLILASVCAAGWFLLLPTDFVLLGKQLVGGSTFIANFVLWWQSGYFSPEAAQKPLLHLWSLGVEEQYYLIFPLICIAFYRAKSRWVLPAAFIAMAVVSMVINVAYVKNYNVASFFLPFSRLWELLLGAGLSLFQQRNVQVQAPWKNNFSPCWRGVAGFLGLILVIGAILGIQDTDPFPGWWALLPTIGAALVIIAGPSSWANRYILSCKPAVFIGLISYPLYLWHWPILSFMKVSKRVWDFDFPHVLKYAAMLSLSFVLAYLTYRYIELPVRRVKQKDQRRRGALWMFGGVVITGIFGILIIVMDGFPARFSSAILAFDHNYGTDESTAWRDGSCFLRPDQSATSFSPSCLDSTDQRVAQTLVFVWGDSHAADLFPGFRALQPQSKVRLAQYTASMCAPILGLQVRERPACHSINDAVMERIRVLRPNIVVLAAYWDVPDLDHDQTTRAEKLLHTIELVKAAGVERVVVIGSVPFWSNDVPMLLINELRHAPGGPTPHRLARTLLTTHDDSLLMATARKAGAFYVSIFDKLCDPTSCLATTGPGWRDVLTFDTSHFTEHGSMISSQLIWGSIIDAAK